MNALSTNYFLDYFRAGMDLDALGFWNSLFYVLAWGFFGRGMANPFPHPTPAVPGCSRRKIKQFQLVKMAWIGFLGIFFQTIIFCSLAEKSQVNPLYLKGFFALFFSSRQKLEEPLKQKTWKWHQPVPGAALEPKIHPQKRIFDVSAAKWGNYELI